MNNITQNNEHRSLNLFLYVVFNNELANKIKATNFVFSVLRQTLLSLIHDAHETKIFKDKLGYIKLLIYRSIYSGPLDFDIYKLYCIYI